MSAGPAFAGPPPAAPPSRELAFHRPPFPAQREAQWGVARPRRLSRFGALPFPLTRPPRRSYLRSVAQNPLAASLLHLILSKRLDLEE